MSNPDQPQAQQQVQEQPQQQGFKFPNLSNMVSLPLYDDHTEGHSTPTGLQLALFQLWCGALFLLFSRLLSGKSSLLHSGAKSSSSPSSSSTNNNGSNSNSQKGASGDSEETKLTVENESGNKPAGGSNGGGETGAATTKDVKTFTPPKPPPTFDEFLRCLVILGVIMIYFYAGDYAKVRNKFNQSEAKR